MTDPELLSLAATLCLPGAPTEGPEREAVVYLADLGAQVALRSRVEAFVQRRVAQAAAAKADAAEAAERERLDPLHVLPMPLEPSDPSDLVFLYRAGGLPSAEHRHPSTGIRVQYRAPQLRPGEQLEVACLPAADVPPELAARAVGTGADFDDLVGMVESWHAARTTRPAARDDYTASDFASSIVESKAEQMIPIIARWGRFARTSQLPGRDAIAHTIRQHLSNLGFLEMMVPFEELERGALSGHVPVRREVPGLTTPQHSAMTRDWALRGGQ